MYLKYLILIILLIFFTCYLKDKNIISLTVFTILLIIFNILLIIISFYTFSKLVYLLRNGKNIKNSVWIILEIYFLINIIYSIIYLLLFINNHLHFKGVDRLTDDNYFKTFVYFFYFSNAIYFTIGFGDIFPQDVLPRMTAISHMLVAYIFSIYYFAKIAQNITVS